MTESEISEIRTAIALIHHLTDDDPLEGWKCMMLKAVLPLLEHVVNPDNEGLGSSRLVIENFKWALSIARVVNYKRPNTTSVCDLEVKEDRVRVTAKSLKTNTKVSPELLSCLPANKGATVSKSTLKRLQAEGRIKEKK